MTICKTCDTSIESSATFCSDCGAKHITKRLTVKGLAQSLLLAITNLDFPFFNTIKNLIFRPENVTLGYINGVRKKYSSPIHFTLIVMSLYGVYQFFNSDFLELISHENFLSGYQAGANGHTFDDRNNSDSIPQIGNDPILDIIINTLQKHNQFLILLAVPAIAFINAKLHKKIGYNFAEHLVVTLYAISLSILCVIILGLIWTPFNTENSVDVFMYCSLAIQGSAITWIIYRSVQGTIYKYFIALIFSIIAWALILTVGILLGGLLLQKYQ